MALARLRHAARTLQYAEIDSLYGIACASDGLALPTVNRPYFSMRRPSTDLAKKTPGFLDQCGRPSSRWACIGPILGSSDSDMLSLSGPAKCSNSAVGWLAFWPTPSPDYEFRENVWESGTQISVPKNV